jgi:DNA-binding CsgD family transcriptional regulator
VRDSIEILEAAYSLEGDEAHWLANLREAVARNIDGCLGVRAQTYDVRTDVVAFRQLSDGAFDARTYAITRKAALPPSQEQSIAPLLRRSFAGSLRGSPAALARLGMAGETVDRFASNLDLVLAELGHADHWWINAQDPTQIGCLFIVPMHRRGLRPREVHGWQCIAAHVASAFRVRRQLAEARESLQGRAPPPEAILQPDGRLKHAEPSAAGGEAREHLRAAVVALDRARGPLRQRDPEQAIELWKALVAGRWSLVEHFESDGRRYVVAHRNDARVPDARGLTERECQVLAYVALGHSNKMVGYELGLSTSTVAGHLASARTKLRLPSSRALLGGVVDPGGRTGSLPTQ